MPGTGRGRSRAPRWYRACSAPTASWPSGAGFRRGARSSPGQLDEWIDAGFLFEQPDGGGRRCARAQVEQFRPCAVHQVPVQMMLHDPPARVSRLHVADVQLTAVGEAGEEVPDQDGGRRRLQVIEKAAGEDELELAERPEHVRVLEQPLDRLVQVEEVDPPGELQLHEGLQAPEGIRERALVLIEEDDLQVAG